MTSPINPHPEPESDTGVEVLLRIARTADSLASENGRRERSFQQEVELWLHAERLVLGKVA